ncbi:MAG: glycosyltransferase [Tepidisphaerales bacterium]
MRVALVHDWLTGMRGGERVLSRVCGLFPDADLFTLIRIPGVGDDRIESMRIIDSGLSRLPAVARYYRWLLPVMPTVIRHFDLRDYDLVISLSHCVAKGVVTDPAAVHVCYCFTPMRYVWTDVGDEGRGTVGQLGLKLFRGYLRRWDRATAQAVDLFLANSHNVAGRIRRCYGRDAAVVYSPVDLTFFSPDPAARRERWYLVVSALTPYKRVDQAIVACGETGRSLKVIGTGPEAPRLARLAARYPHVELLGWQSDDAVRWHYRHCRGVLMPQEEDFGLVPLEAMACGAPVVAYAAGGALETVRDGETGVLYRPQDWRHLAASMDRLEALRLWENPARVAAGAQGFGPDEFDRQFLAATRQACSLKGRTLLC